MGLVCYRPPPMSPAKKPAASKASARESAAKKSQAKKPSRKPVVKKTTRKSAAKKTTAKKTTKKTVAKKATKKPAAKKKAPVKKTVAKKTTKKPVPKKTTKKATAAAKPKKTTAKKAPSRAPARAKKAPPPRPAARKQVLPPRPPARRVRPAKFDAKQLKAIKAQLLQERADLEVQMTEVEEESFTGTQSELTGDVGLNDDFADAGSATFDRENALSIRNNIRDLIDQINRAVVRIDEGNYGQCERCGKPIDAARLKALPHALLCMDCKRREERAR